MVYADADENVLSITKPLPSLAEHYRFRLCQTKLRWRPTKSLTPPPIPFHTCYQAVRHESPITNPDPSDGLDMDMGEKQGMNIMFST